MKLLPLPDGRTVNTLWDWLIEMCLVGYEPIPNGTGEFLYLKTPLGSDHKYYNGPVASGLNRSAVNIVNMPGWVAELERRKSQHD